MKIGILTFHRAINYGAVLQCYALSETLKSFGHDVEVVDYRPDYVERHRQLFQSYNLCHTKGFTNLVKQSVLSALTLTSRKDANKRFDSFLNAYLVLSGIVKTTKDFPSYYDAIFFGSDQIWNPKICYGFDDLYWGQLPHDKTKMITYAASLGEPQALSEKDWLEIEKRIVAFDGLSVRELQLKDALESKLGIHSVCNIDPSLLLTKEKYEALVVDPADEGKYVLAFSIVEIPEFIKFAKKVASELNCKLLLVSAHKTPSLFYKEKTIKQITPTVGEFLGLIKHASCVVTTSFHGTAFSIIYNRPFYTAAHGKSTRVYSLLSSIGLENRLVDMNEKCKDLKFEEIDYEGPLVKLSMLVRDAMSYLNNTIKK